MKVILTENVKTVGAVGEIVNVSQGFARNYLIPNRLGMLADESNTKQMGDYQKMLSKKVAEEKKVAEDTAKKLNGLTLELIKKVGGNGRLFGTVTNTELSAELEKKGISVERRLIVIETPIKTTGSFEVKAKLFSGVEANFNVKVDMSAQQAEEMRAKQIAAEKKAAKKGKEESTEAQAEGEQVTEESAE